jgi:hypothetical protein
MKKLLLVLILSALFIGCSQTEPTKTIDIKVKKIKSDLILKIPIHIKDNGYSNFKTKLITEQKELDKFIVDVKSQKKWQRKKNFLNTIDRANIDFSKNNLLFYRISEKSELIVLAVDIPTSIGKNITVVIGKERLKEKLKKDIQTKGISEYALAYKVDKSAMDITFTDGDSNRTVVNEKLKNIYFK